MPHCTKVGFHPSFVYLLLTRENAYIKTLTRDVVFVSQNCVSVIAGYSRVI